MRTGWGVWKPNIFGDVIYGWPPESIPIGDWRNGDTLNDMLRTEWIKALVDPLDVPEGREGKRGGEKMLLRWRYHYLYPAWKKVAECVYGNTNDFPRPSLFKSDTYIEVDNLTLGCQEEDGDGSTGPCFERFATKVLYSKLDCDTLQTFHICYVGNEVWDEVHRLVSQVCHR